MTRSRVWMRHDMFGTNDEYSRGFEMGGVRSLRSCWQSPRAAGTRPEAAFRIFWVADLR